MQNLFGTIEDYHNLYLKSDVLLLADVFEKFRYTSFKYFNIDPTHCCTLPSFGQQCMLKKTKVVLDDIYEIDMHIIYENGIRGGISSIMKRYAVANNKYLNTYNHDNEESFIVYIDKNSLYPQAMKDFLPYADFQQKENVNEIDIMNQGLTDIEFSIRYNSDTIWNDATTISMTIQLFQDQSFKFCFIIYEMIEMPFT